MFDVVVEVVAVPTVSDDWEVQLGADVPADVKTWPDVPAAEMARADPPE